MHEYDGFSDEVLCALGAAAGEDDVLIYEAMRAHTTFQIGGPADVLVRPRTEEALVKTLNICFLAQSPVLVVGNGSDLLVSDRGYRGVVVLLRDNFAGIEVDAAHGRLTAQAGALLRDAALLAAEEGLSGLEPLWGIPATVGGACFMNAGAYDACTADVLESVRAYVPGKPGERGQVRELSVDELGMGYRRSRVAEEGLVVLSATFCLVADVPASIKGRMDEFQRRREEKQPLDLPSAGSTFKRPEGRFAGKLVQEVGLAGASVGGAQVSPKHCGFIVNTGGATAADVRELVRLVQDQVRAHSGVELEPELRMVGEF